MGWIKKFSHYYLVAEAAKLLGITSVTLISWERKGLITSLRDPDTQWRLFEKDEVHALMEKNGITVKK